jgi:hypothetical protein
MKKDVFSSSNLTSGDLPSFLPLGKAQEAYIDASSPFTKSTNDSSNNSSHYGSDDEGMDLEVPFDASPINSLARK